MYEELSEVKSDSDNFKLDRHPSLASWRKFHVAVWALHSTLPMPVLLFPGAGSDNAGYKTSRVGCEDGDDRLFLNRSYLLH